MASHNALHTRHSTIERGSSLPKQAHIKQEMAHFVLYAGCRDFDLELMVRKNGMASLGKPLDPRHYPVCPCFEESLLEAH